MCLRFYSSILAACHRRQVIDAFEQSVAANRDLLERLSRPEN
jgi:hypothetical protein